MIPLQENMKTNIKPFTYKDIPALEYSNEDSTKLMFLQHGIYGTKEKVMNLLAISFVKLGYKVVAIDACKHGERSAYPFNPKDEDHAQLETFDIVKRTVEDLLKLYHSIYEEDYPTFDIIGISMGGLMAYYMSTQTKHLNQLIALISSPDFEASAHYTFSEEKRQQYVEKSEKAMRLIQSMNPVDHVEKMQFKRAIIMNGKQDEVIPIDQTRSFVQNHESLPIIFKEYDAEHRLIPSMHEDLLALLDKKD